MASPSTHRAPKRAKYHKGSNYATATTGDNAGSRRPDHGPDGDNHRRRQAARPRLPGHRPHGHGADRHALPGPLLILSGEVGDNIDLAVKQGGSNPNPAPARGGEFIEGETRGHP